MSFHGAHRGFTALSNKTFKRTPSHTGGDVREKKTHTFRFALNCPDEQLTNDYITLWMPSF
jgi:hypothetical protein